MATFEYVDIPLEATRLQSSRQDALTHSIRPAHKILTSLPDPSDTSGLLFWHVQLDDADTSSSTTAVSQARAAFSIVPQILLSTSSSSPPATLPPADTDTTSSPKSGHKASLLLSTKDPLSLPIMTTNFRRFVARVGPIFWLQDRIEEIVLWKKGWKRTAVWLTLYGFICYFPRLILLLPHAILLAIMLAHSCKLDTLPVASNIPDGTVDWQANIQGIQNLMGAFSDAYDAVLPVLPFLVPVKSPRPQSVLNPSSSNTQLSKHAPTSISASTSSTISSPTPQHGIEPSVSNACLSSRSGTSSQSALTPQSTSRTHPSYPLLFITLFSFLVLLPVVVANILSLRLIFFLVGVGPVCALHPKLQTMLAKMRSEATTLSSSNLSFTISVPLPTLPHACLSRPFWRSAKRPSLGSLYKKRYIRFRITSKGVRSALRRIADNDRLSDIAWAAPMCSVELWENERWEHVGGYNSRSSSSLVASGVQGASECPKSSVQPPGTWSKTHLRQTERAPWTRARDGWSGVGGEISNLTFSLSPGWAFVETEGWRADLEGHWVLDTRPQDGNNNITPEVENRCADPDGWVYSTDTWAHPRPDTCPGDGWVTRRRRWLRRVYWKEPED